MACLSFSPNHPSERRRGSYLQLRPRLRRSRSKKNRGIRKKRTEAVQLMESVIDTLIEVGNGVTEEELHIAASDLMKARDLLG